MAFLKIDKALSEYYAAMGKNNYYDDKKQGKFFKFCQENGFEEGDVDDEFAQDPSDCMYPEFDEGFPLKPAIDDAHARQKEIFRIIKYCHDNGVSPISKPSYHDIPKNIFNIPIQTNAETKRKCHELYKLQCPVLYKNKEDVLKSCFSISMQNNSYPFLTNLVDSFLRDKALYEAEKRKELQMVIWRTISSYFKKINKEQKAMTETLASGVETFLRRNVAAWDYGEAKIGRIQDSIRDITLYILMASNFVQALLKQSKLTNAATPFQIDFPIAVNKIKKLFLGKYIDNDGDFSDDDGSDDESDDDDDDDQKYCDKVGDIKEKLESNNLPYYTFEMKTNLNDTVVVTRSINNGFMKYKDRLSSESHYKKNPNELKSYPLQKRFCVFIDRRGFDKKLPDKLTIFEPPSDCNSIPKGNVPEWYFNALKTCIIPGKPNNDEPITAESRVGGQIITVSFQAEAQDIIKVYMYWNSRYTRLYPQDLESILPNIFDMDCNNNKQWTQEQQNDVAKRMQFIDPGFEAFYRQVTYKVKDNQFPRQYT